MHKKMDVKFGERLRSLRKKAGLTQADVANSISVVPGSYQRYEYGASPSRKNLNKIIDLFRCSKIWLLHGTGNTYPMDGEFQRYSFISGKTGEKKIDQDKPTSYNKVEDHVGHVAATEKEYDPHGGWKPRPEMQDEDHNILGKAFEIIRSKTIYSTALKANINAFHSAMITEKRNHQTRENLDNILDLQKKKDQTIEKLQNTIEQLQEVVLKQGGQIDALEKKSDPETDSEISPHVERPAESTGD